MTRLNRYPNPSSKTRTIEDSFNRQYIPGTNPPKEYERGRHAGIDIPPSAPGVVGDKAIACVDGVARLKSFGPAFGNQVTIVLPSGEGAFYAHLDTVLVQEGQRVKASDVIGTVGKSGQVSGPHIHWEWRSKWDDWTTSVNLYAELDERRRLDIGSKYVYDLFDAYKHRGTYEKYESAAGDGASFIQVGGIVRIVRRVVPTT